MLASLSLSLSLVRTAGSLVICFHGVVPNSLAQLLHTVASFLYVPDSLHVTERNRFSLLEFGSARSGIRSMVDMGECL